MKLKDFFFTKKSLTVILICMGAYIIYLQYQLNDCQDGIDDLYTEVENLRSKINQLTW